VGILENFIEKAIDPWGQDVPIHIAWFLIRVAAIAGLLFVVVHAIYVRYFAKASEPSGVSAGLLAQVPEHVPRHSLSSRLYHWLMAASMLTLLFTAFLPKVGLEFDWITFHWIAGAVLTVAVLWHIIHASFWQDFWSIWPDRADLVDASRRIQRFFGRAVPPPRKFPKYPLENKLYHGAIIVTGLTAIATGVLMLSRVRTIFVPRNPYLFSDMAWGFIYVLHGLAGVGLIALVIVHVYFAIRPEKRAITKSMIFGWMGRDFYLQHYDHDRWAVETSRRSSRAKGTEGNS
jgi:cytochrome b subunit of formate dehydrogenase